MGVQRLGIQCMGFSGFPQGQQLITELHHTGVGDVLQPKIKGIREQPAGLLAAEHTPVEHLASSFFGLPALGAHKPVGEAHALLAETHRCHHSIAVKGVMHPLAAAFQATRAIAIQGALQLVRHSASDRCQRHSGELLVHVAEGAGPVIPVETSGSGSNSHSERSSSAAILS